MPIVNYAYASVSDPAFWSGLASIVLIDLVLAGDNAIVIALAARNLAPRLQTRAILWGMFGAIAVRVAMTIAVVYLLKIPGLMLIGGVILLPIAWRLLRHEDEQRHPVHVARGFWGAMTTIVIADALMGLDNVLGIAGASKGHLGLVVLGLLISIPLVICGSTLILKLIARWPVVIYIGAATIAWAAARMVTQDDLIDDWFDAHDPLRYAVDVMFVIGIVALGWWAQRRGQQGGTPGV